MSEKQTKYEVTTPNHDRFLDMIERLSATPNINVDMLQKVIDMQTQILDRNARQAYNAAMVRAQANIKKVLKNKRNEQTKSNYADLDAVNDMATPVYTAEGLGLSFYEGEATKPGEVRTYVDIIHEQGHTEKRFIDLEVDDKGMQGAKNKTSIHGKGSSFSYARRYLTCMVFNIPTGDDDDGNNAGKKPVETITADQVKEINEKYKMAKGDVNQFQPYLERLYKVATPEELTSKQALNFIGILNQRIKDMK